MGRVWMLPLLVVLGAVGSGCATLTGGADANAERDPPTRSSLAHTPEAPRPETSPRSHATRGEISGTASGPDLDGRAASLPPRDDPRHLLAAVRAQYGPAYGEARQTGDDPDDFHDDIVLISACPRAEREAALQRVLGLIHHHRLGLFPCRLTRGLVIIHPANADADEMLAAGDAGEAGARHPLVLATPPLPSRTPTPDPAEPRSTGIVVRTSPTPHGLRSFYRRDCRLVVTTDLARALRHEVIHAVHHAWRGYGWAPRWLEEGVAQLFETASDPRVDPAPVNDRALFRVLDQHDSDTLVPLERYVELADGSFHSTHYAQSWALVRWFRAHGRLGDLLQRSRQWTPESDQVADMADVLHSTPTEMSAHWRSWLTVRADARRRDRWLDWWTRVAMMGALVLVSGLVVALTLRAIGRVWSRRFAA